VIEAERLCTFTIRQGQTNVDQSCNHGCGTPLDPDYSSPSSIAAFEVKQPISITFAGMKCFFHDYLS